MLQALGLHTLSMSMDWLLGCGWCIPGSATMLQKESSARVHAIVAQLHDLRA